MSERKELGEISNPDARLDELEYRLEHDSRAGAIEAALESLSDAYPPIRHRATTALAARVDAGLANLFGALLVEDEEAMGRALAEIGVGDIPGLKPSAPIRQAACRVLAHTQGEGTESILTRVAGDEDSDVRYQALVALHQIDISEEELERVVAPRLQDSDPEVAVVAAQITAEHGWRRYAEAMVGIWERMTGEERLQFAISLSELIGEHGAEVDEETVDTLVDELSEALEDEETTAGACRALVNLGSERALEPLRSVVDGWFVHPLLRLEAAGALVELDDETGRQHLRDALDDNRDDVRGYALRLVGRLQLDEHFDHLVGRARSTGYDADNAILALAEWGSDEALEVLEQIAESHPDEKLRQLAGRALVQRRELGEFDPEMFEFL